MSGERVPDPPVEAVEEALAEMNRLVARAGLAADARQLLALASLHLRLRPALDALRSRLDAETDPAARFEPRPPAGRADRAGR